MKWTELEHLKSPSADGTHYDDQRNTVAVIIKIPRRKNSKKKRRTEVVFHCNIPTLRVGRSFWCPTKESRGKVERWGFCGESCNEGNRLKTGSLNMLTDEECKILLEHCPNCFDKSFNPNHELCAGKKNAFEKIKSVIRKKKRKKVLDEEKEFFKRKGFTGDNVKFHYKPSSPKYIPLMNESYPYDWYLGGDESCHANDGSPLYRIVKVFPTPIYLDVR